MHPLMLRFAQPIVRQREQISPGTSPHSTTNLPVDGHRILPSPRTTTGDTRFTKVRDETTDDE